MSGWGSADFIALCFALACCELALLEFKNLSHLGVDMNFGYVNVGVKPFTCLSFQGMQTVQTQAQRYSGWGLLDEAFWMADL